MKKTSPNFLKDPEDLVVKMRSKIQKDAQAWFNFIADKQVNNREDYFYHSEQIDYVPNVVDRNQQRNQNN